MEQRCQSLSLEPRAAMKMPSCYFLISMLAAQAVLGAPKPADAQWGPVSTNNLQFSISVKGKPGDIQTNQPLRLVLRFKNLSTSQTSAIYKPGDLKLNWCFDFVLVDPSGKKQTTYNRVSGGGQARWIRLGTNETQEVEDRSKQDIPIQRTWHLFAHRHICAIHAHFQSIGLNRSARPLKCMY